MSKILIVDDDVFLASIYRTALQQQGWDVEHVTDGEEAMRVVVKLLPDAILLDIMMPRQNGFETLEALKQLSETKQIPVIMFSNLSTKEDIERCMGLGAAGYLIKTHALPEQVIAEIRRVLPSV